MKANINLNAFVEFLFMPAYEFSYFVLLLRFVLRLND